MVQIVVICLCAIIFIAFFSEHHKEYGIYLSIVTAIIVFVIVTDKLGVILDLITRMNAFMNLDSLYMKILLQILGIAFITDFGAGICKDSKQTAIAANIELAGKIMILVVSAPIVMAIFNLIDSMI